MSFNRLPAYWNDPGPAVLSFCQDPPLGIVDFDRLAPAPKRAGVLFRNDHDFGWLRSLATETEIIPMSKQNQTDPGVQNEGSKRDLQRKESDQLNLEAEKAQQEKLKQGGDDEITITTNNTLY